MFRFNLGLGLGSGLGLGLGLGLVYLFFANLHLCFTLAVLRVLFCAVLGCV